MQPAASPCPEERHTLRNRTPESAIINKPPQEDKLAKQISDKILRRKRMATNCSPVTELLRRWSHGDKAALGSLMPLVYDDLRRLANFYLQQEGNARTLQSTALVHEVYLRLCGQQDPAWVNRAHFFAVAAKMIRRILVDHAREKSAVKRGGEIQPRPLDEALTIPAQSEIDQIILSSVRKEGIRSPSTCIEELLPWNISSTSAELSP